MKSEDIAKIAGVSRSTVSRVINNYPNVPPETYEKVMKVIQEHHYVPNTSARALAGKKSNTIGLFLFIDGFDKEEDRIYKNDFFGSYMDLLVDYASLKDYFVLVCVISGKEHYEKIQQAFLEKRIDAGIIIGTQSDTLKEIHMDRVKSSVVLFDYDLKLSDNDYTKSSRVSTINSDDPMGIRDAVSYLKGLGHRRIGFIKGLSQARSGDIRYKAFVEAMADQGLSIHPGHVLEGAFHRDTAYQSVKQMIKEESTLPSAIISANDFMALAAIKAFEEEGIKVPEDISIIGFDNTLHGQISEPALTTIGPDFKAMAEKAIDILDKQIKGEEKVQHVTFEVNFYKRDTCKKI